DLARRELAKTEQQLTLLALDLAPGADVPELALAVDDEPLPRAAWAKPIALDPGEHSITSSIPGRPPRKELVVVQAEPGTQRFVVFPFAADKPKEVVKDLAPQRRRFAGYVALGTGGAGLILGSALGAL